MVMQNKYPRPSPKGYYCPRCGRQVTESDLWDSENEYPFQCVYCDEDFYSIECIEERNITWVKELRIRSEAWERYCKTSSENGGLDFSHHPYAANYSSPILTDYNKQENLAEMK